MEENKNEMIPKQRENKFTTFLSRVLAGIATSCVAAIIMAATIRVVMWIL